MIIGSADSRCIVATKVALLYGNAAAGAGDLAGAVDGVVAELGGAAEGVAAVQQAVQRVVGVGGAAPFGLISSIRRLAAMGLRCAIGCGLGIGVWSIHGISQNQASTIPFTIL